MLGKSGKSGVNWCAAESHSLLCIMEASEMHSGQILEANDELNFRINKFWCSTGNNTDKPIRLGFAAVNDGFVFMFVAY